jgi:hypothetical protein
MQDRHRLPVVVEQAILHGMNEQAQARLRKSEECDLPVT